MLLIKLKSFIFHLSSGIILIEVTTMELKQFIKEYKSRYHLTNQQIAKEFGVTHTTVGRWLNGSVKSLQQETIDKMSEVLEFDVGSLLNGTAITLKKPILGIAKGGYDLFLDKEIPYMDVTKTYRSFFLDFIRIEYEINGKTYQYKPSIANPSSYDEKVVLTVPRQMSTASKVTLILTVRNKSYRISLQ